MDPSYTIPKTPRVGIVGATGKVGTALRHLLTSRGFPAAELRLFASARSAGSAVSAASGGALIVADATDAAFDDLDIVLFAGPGAASRELAPRAAHTGAVVIDVSPAWRADPRVPLVAGGVNARALDAIPRGIVAGPCAVVTAAAAALKPLHDAAGLTRVAVGDGAAPPFLPTAKWVPPPADTAAGRLAAETRRVLDLPALPVACASANGAGLAIAASFARELAADEAAALMSQESGFAPRWVRADPEAPNALALVVDAGDPAYAAALNAVRIAEAMLPN